MNPYLECIRTTVSRHLPHAMFLYLPRVANGIADDLAGQASRFMLAKFNSDPINFVRNSGPVSIRPTFPISIFQAGGFHIQSFEQPWVQPVFTLVERPAIDHGLLRRHLTLHPHHRQLIESYLSLVCRNAAALKLGTPRKLMTTWGENTVAQWADKDCQGQLDSFCLEKTIAKLILKDPFMSWSDAWDCIIYLTICPSQPLMTFALCCPVTPTSEQWKPFARRQSNSFP